MTRSALVVAILGFAFSLAAQSADTPKIAGAAKPEPSKGAPVYVKIFWPVEPGTVNEKDRPVVESWVSKSIDKRFKSNLIAVSEWVPLVEKRYEATNIWDGKVDEKVYACSVSSVIAERKKGRIKIVVYGWAPVPAEVALILDDEPGSREVVPVSDAETKQGVPYVAVFVGVQAKVERFEPYPDYLCRPDLVVGSFQNEVGGVDHGLATFRFGR
jgi:hypothetical protein